MVVCTRLAQQVERWPFKPVVRGSSPLVGKNFLSFYYMRRRTLRRGGDTPEWHDTPKQLTPQPHTRALKLLTPTRRFHPRKFRQRIGDALFNTRNLIANRFKSITKKLSPLKRRYVKFRRRNLKSAFEVLGIPLDSSVKEIEKAYRKLSKTTHPDRIINGPMSAYIKKEDMEHYTFLQQNVNGAYAKIKEELNF